MSGNSALAAAKRRRAINADTTTNANLNKPQNINSQSNIKAKDSKGVNNAQYQSSSHNVNNFRNTDINYQDLPEYAKYFMIPNIPADVQINHAQLLSLHHTSFNKLAIGLSTAINNITETISQIASNCDNLNDRLSVLEESSGSTKSSGISDNIKKDITLLQSASFKNQQDIETCSSVFNLFKSEIAEKLMSISDNINNNVNDADADVGADADADGAVTDDTNADASD
jgi:hypothetical protein